ncbi:MAG: hypothetical protein N4A41_08540 [Crocinitomicaceae bacterium]|jgi:uncharacterized membrane protein YoaK (UPF0700 family)|nr:hypothetical protein [Crocinitomicaceae bacterium]
MIKFLKNIDQKQLENNPLLWSTRFYPLLFAGIGMWVLSFLLGFTTFTSKSLLDHHYERHFGTSFFSWFFVVLVIVILTFWAIQFFKHNAFERFYPLKPFHFQKKFLLIFLPFLLITTGYYPFTYGAKLKTSVLLHEEELAADLIELNSVSAFLPMSSEDYDLRKRSYPAPFPCEMNVKNDNSTKWDHRGYYLSNSKTKEIDETTDLDVFDWDSAKSVKIGSREYVFYRDSTISLDEKGCDLRTVITEILEIEKDKYQLSSYHALNYSGLLINTLYGSYFDLNSPTYYSKVDPLDAQRTEFGTVIFRKNYAKETHRIIQEHDWKTLEKKLTKALFILNKYQINHNLSPRTIIKYLQKKNFTYLDQIILDYERSMTLEQVLNSKSYSLYEYNSMSFEEKLEIYSEMFIDTEALRQLNLNFFKSSNKQGLTEFNPVILYFTFNLAFLFFLLSVVKLKSFFISIPVWGVLFILVGVSMAAVQPRSSFETVLPSMILFLMLMVIALNWWFLRDQKISLKPLHVSIPMALIAIPSVAPLLATLMHFGTRKEVEDYCAGYGDFWGNYEYLFDGALMNPYFLFGLTLVSSLCSFYLLRVYRAKPE